MGRPAHARRRARTHATTHVIAASLRTLCMLLSMHRLKVRALFLPFLPFILLSMHRLKVHVFFLLFSQKAHV
jgi:hypothetical protein